MSSQTDHLLKLSKTHDSASLRYGLGLAYMDDKLPQLAQYELQKAIEMQPDFAAAWKALGKALAAIDNLPGAKAAWTEGILVARKQGNIQAAKEMEVFLRRTEKTKPGPATENLKNPAICHPDHKGY
ncbi:MAG TPA: hypothetical protein VND43_00865 [Burkholderiales bacterium]|nr:hypothetical protein [Burkholderiales bacterium]